MRCTSCWYGRYIKDWSQIVGGAVGTAGAAATATGIAITSLSTSLSTAGIITASAGVGALASTFFLLCLRISCLKPIKDLENQVMDLRSENDRLKGEIYKLDGHVKELEKLRDSFNKVHDDAEANIGELKQIFEAHDLKEVTEKVHDTVDKLTVLQKLYKEFRDGVQGFASNLSSFKEANQEFSVKVVDLSQNVDVIDKKEEEISDEIDQFENANKYYSDQNHKLSELLGGLQTDLGCVSTRYTDIQTALEKLSDFVAKLTDADDKFNQGTKSIQENVLPQLQQMLKEFNAISDKISSEESSGDTVIAIDDNKGKEKEKKVVQ
jgi:chromosome segregation ATPase